MDKTVAHPLFYSKLIDLKNQMLARVVNDSLSLGGVSYYINDEIFSTRVVLFNYFSHYANKSFGSDWEIKLYSSAGQIIFSKKGSFVDQETVVLDLGRLKLDSQYGIVVAHIKPNDNGKILGKSFDSIFFTEHYNRKSLYHDIAHSLRWPTPIKYIYNITGHGFSFIPNAKPYVLISNSYEANTKRHVWCRPVVELVNHRGKSEKIAVNAIPPMGCIRVDLLESISDIKNHFGTYPGMIRVTGENVMRKPFFYQTDGNYICSDHL